MFTYLALFDWSLIIELQTPFFWVMLQIKIGTNVMILREKDKGRSFVFSEVTFHSFSQKLRFLVKQRHTNFLALEVNGYTFQYFIGYSHLAKDLILGMGLTLSSGFSFGKVSTCLAEALPTIFSSALQKELFIFPPRI